MIDYQTSFTNTNGVAFPGTLAVNATGPATTDGTEFVKLFIDDLWGARQAMMDYANLTPNSVTEGPGASQVIEAIQKGNAVGPGKYTWWGLFNTPSVTGDRVILLTEGATQGVLRATYGALDSAVYVGDGNNATAPYFYHADDAAGTTRNTTGIYLILPPGKQLYEKSYSQAAGDFTVTTPAGTTIIYSSIIPYISEDGSVFIRGKIAYSGSSTGNHTITISGLTFNVVSPVLVMDAGGGQAYDAKTVGATGNIGINVVSYASTAFYVYFDSQVSSLPTWVNGFNYKLGITY